MPNQTYIFLQITNQMITACKSYISCQKTETVWTQNQADVVRKLNDCIKLNEEYQRCFHKTKEKLEKMPNERPFEFSEMYIFGKFDTFTRRLKKIIEMFETISMYSHLSESKIEGTVEIFVSVSAIHMEFPIICFGILIKNILDNDEIHEFFFNDRH